MTDLIDNLSIMNLISDLSRPPDHSIIITSVHLSPGDGLSTGINSNGRSGGVTHNVPLMREMSYNNESTPEHITRVDVNAETLKRPIRKYDVSTIPDNFMSNITWRNELNVLIDKLQTRCDDQNDIDILYNDMCKYTFAEMDKFLSYKEFTGRKTGKLLKFHKPYWDNRLTELWKDMCIKEKEFLKTMSGSREKSLRRCGFLNARSKFDKYLRSSQREYRKTQIDEIEKVCTNDPRKFWEHIKTLGPRKKAALPEMVRINNGLSNDPSVVLGEWRNTFENLYNPTLNHYDKDFYETAMTYIDQYETNAPVENNAIINGNITFGETVKIITKLKSKKAVGVDYIPNEIIKQPGLHYALFKLFVSIFDKGIVPSIWLKAIINPIPKGSSKDPYVPLNYRGISLLSCISKTYTSLINERINKFCEQNDLLVDEQNGFRKGRSCADHLFTLTSVIRNRLSEKKSTFCAFIDMEKAFDFLDRNLLLYRLLLYKIDGKLFKSIRALYGHTSACVKLNANFSSWFMSNCGVRQGDSLSPILFALYINDLAREIIDLNKGIKLDNINISILLYADDIVLISESEQNLQDMLDYMHRWCFKWKLKLNVDKSSVVHFRPKRQRRSEFSFHFGPNNLNTVDKYKYLGILIDEHLTYEHCAKVLSDSAGRALGGIINKFKSLRDVGFTTFERMYDAGVMTVNNYASEIWGFKDFQCCKKVQNRAMRYYLGVHKFAPISGMQGDLGWLSVRYRRYKCMVNYWNRLVKMSDNRLTKRVFIYDRERNRDNWSSDMRIVYLLLGMDDIFDSNTVCNKINVADELSRINNIHWHNEIQNKPKLRTYVLFKNNVNIESYVKKHMQKRTRSCFAQFRLGILPLHIETGRYDNTPLLARTCKLCESEQIEDEYHFLMVCPVYTELRLQLFQKSSILISNFETSSDTDNFVSLVKSSQKYVAQFVDAAYQRRRNILYT